MKIAVINAGSSSLKFKVIEMPSAAVIASQLIEHIGEDGGVSDHHEALALIEFDLRSIDVVGHRVVHGGEFFSRSVVVDEVVMQKIDSLSILAPLHNPANLMGIEAMQQKMPEIPQIAVFDTAFHTSLAQEAYLYALPLELHNKHHIRRYGFHGTSHAYIASQAAKMINKPLHACNLITLHLGNGASACAIQNGKSIDTSMGFTPLEGLVMGSRCGDIDPSIVLYLQRELGMQPYEVDTLLNKHSGLSGIAQENDMRTLLQREDEEAKLAVKIMVRRIQKYIGSYMVLLEGKVDALVFSGGIGENSKEIREMILDNGMLKHLKSLVIKTDEELAIAQECYAIVSGD